MRRRRQAGREPADRLEPPSVCSRTLLRLAPAGRLSVEAEEVPALLHVRRQRRGDVERTARRVGNDDPPSVEMQLLLDSAREIPALFRAEIFGIADDRMTDMGGMGAELVGASGDRAHAEPGELLAGLVDDRIERDGVAGFVGTMASDAHALALRPALLGQPGRNATLLRFRNALHQRPVDLAGGAGAERLGQLLRREPRPGDDEHTRGVAVEPVHQPRLLALAVAEGIEHGIDMAGEAGTALHGKTGRLVENEDIIVFVEEDAAQEVGVADWSAPCTRQSRWRGVAHGPPAQGNALLLRVATVFGRGSLVCAPPRDAAE